MRFALWQDSVGLRATVGCAAGLQSAMSLPRIVSQVVILGSQILGKAFVEAYRQAARNARSGTSHSTGAGERGGANLGSNLAGEGGPMITRKHKMTVDEACQILNVKNVAFSEGPNQPIVSEELSNMLKAYERMFQANEKTSKYLLSKVVRAKDRISAEVELAKTPTPPQPPPQQPPQP
ncbi:hypothetical protein KEM48_000506 [Puccinia striiformis f. sp. tritici PST-130]|nr:hypothetical protein KEM48_000506 [Puccinia striiformis f. sp. tritici PST-130]